MYRIILITLVGVLSCAAFAAGDNTDSQKSPQKKLAAKKTTADREPAKKRKPHIEITSQVESVAMAFVRQHHEEIADLLPPLKKTRPKEYEQAIRDLYRSSQRLENISQRDRVRYELELSYWKAGSRIQLMAARLKMGDSPELRNQLRQTLNERIELRLTILRRDQERLSWRLDKLNNQMENLEASRAQDVERQLLLLTKNPKNRLPKAAKKIKKSTSK